jgi:hypothetical protein
MDQGGGVFSQSCKKRHKGQERAKAKLVGHHFTLVKRWQPSYSQKAKANEPTRVVRVTVGKETQKIVMGM